MDTKTLNSVHIDELKKWKKQLNEERLQLDNEISECEEVLERTRIKSKVASTVFTRTNIEMISEQYHTPLSKELTDLQRKFDRLKFDNWQKDRALEVLIENIDRQLRHFNVDINE